MCDEKRAWAVCEAVRAARKRKGYTQEKLGELMNRHPSYVAKVEQGKLTMSLDGLFDFMDALDVDANTIVGIDAASSITGAPSIDVMLSQQEEKTRMYLTKVFVGMIEQFPNESLIGIKTNNGSIVL